MCYNKDVIMLDKKLIKGAFQKHELPEFERALKAYFEKSDYDLWKIK